MNRFLFIAMLISSWRLFSQETSINNYSGDWGSNASWSTGWTDGSPAFLNLPESAGDITIFGDIQVGSTSASQNLTFAANNDAHDFTVNDTLIVFGDVTFANKSMNLNLGNDAVLIILGDLDMNNKINIASGGTLVVSGNFNKNGSQGSYTGDGDVYAGSFSGDAETTIDSGGGDSSFTIDDLSDDGFGPIEEFVNGGGATPLPVDLLYFESSIDNDVKLNWATALEINNDYFSIERSEDGSYFYEIGRVDGNGNTNEVIEYGFADKFAYAPIEYYRLKQVDFDGQHEYFEVQRVSTGLDAEKKSLTAYPTVVKNDILSLSSTQPFIIKEILFYNLSGGETKDLSRNAYQQNTLSYNINLAGLRKGVYLVKAQSTHGVDLTTRIIVK